MCNAVCVGCTVILFCVFFLIRSLSVRYHFYPPVVVSVLSIRYRHLRFDAFLSSSSLFMVAKMPWGHGIIASHRASPSSSSYCFMIATMLCGHIIINMCFIYTFN